MQRQGCSQQNSRAGQSWWVRLRSVSTKRLQPGFNPQPVRARPTLRVSAKNGAREEPGVARSPQLAPSYCRQIQLQRPAAAIVDGESLPDTLGFAPRYKDSSAR